IHDPAGSQRSLLTLVDKINSLNLKGNWSVVQSVPVRLDEDTAIPIDPKALEIGGRHWLIQSYFHWERDPLTKWSDHLVRQIFYRPLISALETGEFKRLRMCKRKECQKFFVAEDLRRDFCSEPCRNTFNNKERLAKTAEGLNYFTKLRHDKRKRNLQKARRSLREGKSLEKVSTETGLSLQILKRAGLLVPYD